LRIAPPCMVAYIVLQLAANVGPLY
jgi:hypothetical protein